MQNQRIPTINLSSSPSSSLETSSNSASSVYSKPISSNGTTITTSIDSVKTVVSPKQQSNQLVKTTSALRTTDNPHQSKQKPGLSDQPAVVDTGQPSSNKHQIKCHQPLTKSHSYTLQSTISEQNSSAIPYQDRKKDGGRQPSVQMRSGSSSSSASSTTTATTATTSATSDGSSIGHRDQKASDLRAEDKSATKNMVPRPSSSSSSTEHLVSSQELKTAQKPITSASMISVSVTGPTPTEDDEEARNKRPERKRTPDSQTTTSSTSSNSSKSLTERQPSSSSTIVSNGQGQDGIDPPAPSSLSRSTSMWNTAQNRRFHRHFPQVDSQENLINYYSCALLAEILLQGYLYISDNYFAFYSNIFGYKTQLLIPISSVISVTKERTAKVFPNAVGICTEDGKQFVFGSLLSREATFKLMQEVWTKTITNISLLDGKPLTCESGTLKMRGDQIANLSSDRQSHLSPEIGPGQRISQMSKGSSAAIRSSTTSGYFDQSSNDSENEVFFQPNGTGPVGGGLVSSQMNRSRSGHHLSPCCLPQGRDGHSTDECEDEDLVGANKTSHTQLLHPHRHSLHARNHHHSHHSRSSSLERDSVPMSENGGLRNKLDFITHKIRKSVCQAKVLIRKYSHSKEISQTSCMLVISIALIALLSVWSLTMIHRASVIQSRYNELVTTGRANGCSNANDPFKHSFSRSSHPHYRRYLRESRRNHESEGGQRKLLEGETSSSFPYFTKLLSADRDRLNMFKLELHSNMHHLKIVRSSLQQLITSIDALMILNEGPNLAESHQLKNINIGEDKMASDDLKTHETLKLNLPSNHHDTNGNKPLDVEAA